MFRLKCVWVVLCPLAWAFNLTVGTPTSCDNLQMSWTGGVGPFQIFLTPIFGRPQIFRVPSSAVNNGQGSFTTQLVLPATQRLLVTLFDSSVTSGSSSVISSISTDILIVGNSLGGSCNTTSPGVDFDFDLNTDLQQCGPYIFSGYSGAVQPVSIIGLIPSGQSFGLLPPSGPTSFSWIADVAAETSIVFMMLDSQERNGGSSDVKQVGITDDSSCLNSSSPSSTTTSPSSATTSPSSTSSSTASTMPAAPSSSTSPSHGLSAAVIIGAAAGGLVSIAVLGGLVLFFLRKQNSRHVRSDIDLSYESTSASNIRPYTISSSTNLSQQYSPPPHFDPPAQYEHRPFIPPPDPEPLSYPRSRHSMTNSQSELLSPELEQSGSSSSFMSTAQRKAGMVGVTSYQPSRFVLHTDVDDAPHEEELIELPPQYSDNRRPLQLLDQDVELYPPRTGPRSPF